MEASIIDRAKQLVSSDNISFEKTVESLEESRQAYEAMRLEAEQIKQQADKEKQQAQKYKDSIEELREKELENARSQAIKIVEQAKRSAYALTQELERLKKESEKSRDKSEMARRAKQLMRKGLGEFDEITNPITPLDDGEDYTLPRPLKVGDEVLLVDIGKTAEVTATENKKGEVEVLAGIMKIRTPLSNLRLVTNGGKQAPKKRVPAKNEHIFRPADGGKSECDLRGMNVEEAIIEIDRNIDRCMRIGLTELSIIHGKGTGALRKGVQDYLRKHRFVKSFRLGTYGEGESGVTIVTLK